MKKVDFAIEMLLTTNRKAHLTSRNWSRHDEMGVFVISLKMKNIFMKFSSFSFQNLNWFYRFKWVWEVIGGKNTDEKKILLK